MTCVSWETSTVFSAAGWTSFYDGSGNPIALIMDDVVYCGAQLSDYSNLGKTVTDAGFVFGDGRVFPAVHRQRSNPECAEWGPFGLSVVDTCQSVDAGTCQ
jgi:hypothetical protein